MSPRRNFRQQMARGGRPIRPMDWKGLAVDVGLGASEIAASWVVLPSDMKENFTDPTLMASRWFLTGYKGSLQTGVAAGFVGWGIIAWDSPQSDLTPFDPPNPILDLELDWVNRWIQPIPGNSPALIINGPTWDNVHLSKAKRRLGNQRSILAVMATFGVTGGADVAMDVRVLIKE